MPVQYFARAKQRCQDTIVISVAPRPARTVRQAMSVGPGSAGYASSVGGGL